MIYHINNLVVKISVLLLPPFQIISRFDFFGIFILLCI
jgi:hypothetical protein